MDTGQGPRFDDIGFNDAEFERAVIRMSIEDEWYELTPVSASVDVGRQLPIVGIVHVISACNPGFRESDDVNGRRHVELEQRLQDEGVEYGPAVGMSTDGTWVEPSWVVFGLDRETACEIGRDFGQVAVFEIDERHVRVVHCAHYEVVATNHHEVTPLSHPLT